MVGFIKKKIAEKYVPIEEHKKLEQEIIDLKGELGRLKDVFGLFHDVVVRWRDNKIVNLRAINTISRMMLGKKEKETK